MTNFLSIVKENLPVVTRVVASMPFMDWVSYLKKNKGCIIPVYTSVKSKENPEGFKFNTVRELLANPALIMDSDIREAVLQINEGLLYCISRNKQGFKEMLVFYAEHRQSFEDRHFKVLPISDPLRSSPGKSVEKIPEGPKPSKPIKTKK